MQLIGRRSSAFTRIPLYFAERLGVAYDFVSIPDMMALETSAYGDNPALKLPILRLDGTTLFGAQNICRAIVERAMVKGVEPCVVWPEDLGDAISRNAQELVWHCLAAQVQLVMGTVLAKLPPDNIYFVKARTGLESSLAWLDAHFHRAIAALPSRRDLSLLEVSTLCLVDHLAFRPTIQVASYTALTTFAARFGADDVGRRTAFRFDT